MKREFGKTIDEKESELDRIDKNILKVQKALQLVRFGAVCDYYAHSVAKVRNSVFNNLISLNQGELWCPRFQQTQSQSENVSIHPAVRKLLGGKRPKDVIQETNSTRTNQAIIQDKPQASMTVEGWSKFYVHVSDRNVQFRRS